MAAALKCNMKAVSARTVSARRVAKVTCSAQPQQATKAIAAAALAAVVGFGTVDAAFADVAGLTPCADSKAYAKVQKKEVKGLEKRLKKYEAGSAPALALQATIERTKARFANYAKANVLCGTDGLPHLIADPGLAFRYGHQFDIFVPTLGFLYVAGYIGYVGRSYLISKKSTTSEIIIDVPEALKLASQGAGWPLKVVAELRAGTLTEKAENITVSPR